MSQSPLENRLDANYVDGWKALTENILAGESFSGFEKNCAFLNLGEGQFATTSAVSGFNFDDDARGMALVDWDNDGDTDIWLSNRTAPRIRYLENTSSTGKQFLAVSLRGADSNRDAIGTRVTLHATDDKGQPQLSAKTLRAGEGFLSQSSKTLVFTPGKIVSIEKMDIRWPSGEKTILQSLELGQHIVVTEDAEGFQTKTRKPATALKTKTFVTNPANESSEAQIRLTTQVPLPRLPWKTFVGAEKNTEELLKQGKPWLLNLWASWCQPCHKELRAFIREKDRLDTMDLEILALSVDGIGDIPGDPKLAASLLKRWQYPYQQGVASERLTNSLQIIQDELFDAKRPLPVPVSFLIDKNGYIAAIYRGPVDV